MSIRNLPYIRSKDPRLYEALRDLQSMIQAPAQEVKAAEPAKVIDAPSKEFSFASPSGGMVSSVLSGSYESRPAMSSPNSLWIETSRSTIASQSPFPMYQYQAGAWKFIGGMFFRTQAQLATLSATLGANDAGAIVYVASPFCHRLKWGGAAWDWEDPADRSGRYAYWPEDVPDGWHAVDGTTVTRLKGDGSTEDVDLVADVITNPLYLKTGSPWDGAINSAVAPAIDAIAASADVPVPVVSAAGTDVAAGAHTHPAPSASLAGGDPIQNMICPLYYRL